MDNKKKDIRMPIGEIAKMFDMTPRTLRFYEELKLIKPERTGTTRVYTYREVVRLKLILRGRRLNFTFEEIRHILDLYKSIDQGRDKQIKLLLEILDEKSAALATQMREIKIMQDDIDNVRNMCHDALQRNGKNGVAKRRRA